ncbi:MAG: ATP-grasp domain-containing protein [Anaerolineales bacterium]|nr:ATP-grasp domain-containing protein [Anaerolineales bacterium]MCB9126748.1 ATP-grasp domain-containing protein [Ardenticatenales bacterium]
MAGYKILLTDGAMRRTLSAARALAAEGHRVTVGEDSRYNTTFFSRFCHERLVYPSPRHAPADFIDYLVDYLQRVPHDCLLPMEADTLDLILAHRERFDALTTLPFVPLNTYLTFRDKGNGSRLASHIGIPQPETIYPSSPQHVVEETKALGFPLILKPRHGWGSRGIRVVHTAEELQRVYRALHQESSLPLVQRYVTPGAKYFCSALMDKEGRLVRATVHRELRNHPRHLGPSTAQRSEAWPLLIEYTEWLLRAAGWYGVANADFMIDGESGEPLFMEVNPRFWGSLQATQQAGVNMPDLLVRMAMGESITPDLSYELGQVTRALLPFDILHFLTNPDRLHMQPSFFDFFGPKVAYDIISRRDPGPILGFLLTSLRYCVEPEVWIRQARMERVGRWLARIQRKPLSDLSRASAGSHAAADLVDES